jgi:alpha-tubulin suppressor-like RCC1 family protein
MTTRWNLLLGTCATVFIAAIPVEAATRARLAEGITGRDTRLMSSLDAGEVHSCAVNNDGTVRCWGGNGHGQLGDDSHTDRLTPVLVRNINNAVAGSAGLTHTRAHYSSPDRCAAGAPTPAGSSATKR